MFTHRTLAAVVTLGATFTAVQSADAAFTQGFETDAAGWSLIGDATLTRVASGGGSLGYASASGNYHAEITNSPGDYSATAGDAGYTYFGGRSGVYAGPTVQSLDIYIDPTWAAPAKPASMAFQLNMAPANTSATSNRAGETNFQFRLDDAADTVRVNGHGEGDFATITEAGWYTFETTFSKGATDADLIDITLAVYDSNGDSLGSLTHGPKNIAGQFGSDLGSGGYAWLTVWQNGFANDRLAIDNAVSSVPEPASLALLALGGGVAMLRRGRRA